MRPRTWKAAWCPIAPSSQPAATHSPDRRPFTPTTQLAAKPSGGGGGGCARGCAAAVAATAAAVMAATDGGSASGGLVAAPLSALAASAAAGPGGAGAGSSQLCSHGGSGVAPTSVFASTALLPLGGVRPPPLVPLCALSVAASMSARRSRADDAPLPAPPSGRPPLLLPASPLPAGGARMAATRASLSIAARAPNTSELTPRSSATGDPPPPAAAKDAPRCMTSIAPSPPACMA